MIESPRSCVSRRAFLLAAEGNVLSHIAQGTDLRQSLSFLLHLEKQDGKPSPGAADVRGDQALSLNVLSDDYFGL